ncbi:MAG: hypothetical protein NC191_00295 [Muribaculaceae bacterium]|nr:hypothetical protein [Muribaculaceae bacterium]
MFKLNRYEEVPSGFRHISDDEAANQFLKLDIDKSYTITKNEWMLGCLKILAEDVAALDAEAPDAIMKHFQELSDEFDTYDLDGNKVIDYLEYKNFLMKNVLISE